MKSLYSEEVRNWAHLILQDAQQGLCFQEDGLSFVSEIFYLLFLRNGLRVQIPEPTIHISDTKAGWEQNVSGEKIKKKKVVFWKISAFEC